MIGSNVIVAGTAIFGASDPIGVISTLKATVNAAQAKIGFVAGIKAQADDSTS